MRLSKRWEDAFRDRASAGAAPPIQQPVERGPVHAEPARHPGRAVVGYGAHEDLAPQGFRPLGPLRVWLRE